MGGFHSTENIDRAALKYFQIANQHPSVLPDVGIDESLLKYSGTDSNAVLQAYSDLQMDIVPGYIERLGSGLAPVTKVPNAVGLGALVISMIMEICIKGNSRTETPYSILRRVFGVEKASSVRDTMSEYLKRHRTYINNNKQLMKELHRLEAQLSNHLTILRNSLLYDGQMSTRGFKFWVNGVSFHVQMLLHEARLNIQAGKPQTDYVNSIKAAIDLYVMDLDRLLAKYKAFKLSNTIIRVAPGVVLSYTYSSRCEIKDSELSRTRDLSRETNEPCGFPELNESFINVVFSKYEPISGLKSHFLDIKNNVIYLIHQNDSFTLPSAA